MTTMKTLLQMAATALVLSLFSACIPAPAFAQNASLGTNLAGYANFGTLNCEASLGVARRWSVTAGLRYNPFTFPGGAQGGPREFRQRTVALGTRFWPWHIYSGWWLAAKAQYQEYNVGGFVSPETREGDRVGGALSAGYTYMIGPHFNVEAGAGVWAGRDWYTLYSCPSCGRTLDKGNAKFLMLNEILLGVTYVF